MCVPRGVPAMDDVRDRACAQHPPLTPPPRAPQMVDAQGGGRSSEHATETLRM